MEKKHQSSQDYFTIFIMLLQIACELRTLFENIKTSFYSDFSRSKIIFEFKELISKILNINIGNLELKIDNFLCY